MEHGNGGAVMRANLIIDISKLDAVVGQLRKDLADLLRERADDEISSYVATRLREVADEFEATKEQEH